LISFTLISFTLISFALFFCKWLKRSILFVALLSLCYLAFVPLDLSAEPVTPPTVRSHEPNRAITTDTIIEISAGGKHTCALTDAGDVICWGSNYIDQFSNGTTSSNTWPVYVSGLESTAVAVSAGQRHTCALLDTGRVQCWGWNSGGVLGDGTSTNSSLPVTILGLNDDIVAISAGDRHNCVLTDSGAVRCWGQNYQGQLGDGTTNNSKSPVDVIGLESGVTEVVAGKDHTCALTEEGSVKCWGHNGWGQLGNNSVTNSSRPTDVVGLDDSIISISSKRDFTCALTETQAVKCWGDNYRGYLGDGTTVNRIMPVDVIGLDSGVTAISAGRAHICAIIEEGVVKCWGSNGSGELGNGSNSSSSIPIAVSGLDGVISVSAGGGHTCALLASGYVQCWGWNSSGQLGVIRDTVNSSLPADVLGMASESVAISAGNDHACAVTALGRVKCWGGNFYGQLGANVTTWMSGTPTDVNSLNDDVATISAGNGYNCALTNAGGIKCWGGNSSGELGDGTTVNRRSPVPVSGINSGIDVSTGRGHACALIDGGVVKCWGRNDSGQLGDGTTVSSLSPINVMGMDGGIMAVSAGAMHTCALTDSGEVKCWGRNDSGQLGDGTNIDTSVPVDVDGMSDRVVAIAAREGHTCALTVSGAAKCWGENSSGQLGHGTNRDQKIPVDVRGLSSGVIAIAAGISHNCALTNAGEIKCWGSNSSGQLGDGTTMASSIPVTVNGVDTEVVAIAAGGSFTCVLTSAGDSQCWGNNGSGQLGSGRLLQSTLPIPASQIAVNLRQKFLLPLAVR